MDGFCQTGTGPDMAKPYIVHFGPAVLLIDSQGRKKVLETREIVQGKEYVLDQEGWKLRPSGDLKRTQTHK